MTVRDPVTPADAALAGFLQSIELAVIQSYDNVLPMIGTDNKPTVTKFQSHHRDHATALAKFAGASAAKGPNGTLALVLAARLQTVTDERTALTFVENLENQVTETNVFALGTLTSPDVVKHVATVVPVTAGHAATLGALVGSLTLGLFPNGALEGTLVGGTDNTDPKVGFDPVAFPVG